MSITQGDPVRGAWVAPLVATVVTLPAAFLAYAIGSLAPMACDACSGAKAVRFTQGFDSAFTLLQVGLAVALVLLLISWCLPQTEPDIARRRVFAALAPSAVVLSLITFAGMVPSPN